MALRRMLAWPLPRPLRAALLAAATAVLMWASLAPTQDLPTAIMFWDKAQHALAYLVLAGLGLALFPRRPLAIGAYSMGVGALVEVLQTAMAFGRHGDLQDLVADAAGVAGAFALAGLGRGLIPRS